MDWAKLFETLKGFVTGILVRWVLKLAGGWLIGLGFTEGNITEWVSGVVVFLFGILISLLQQKKAVEQTPPTPTP